MGLGLAHVRLLRVRDEHGLRWVLGCVGDRGGGGRGRVGRRSGFGGRGRRLGRRLARGLLGGEPGVEFGLLDDPDDDRHEAVVATAELGALAAVRADPVGAEPELVDVARDRVLLDAEVRHPPGVDHVGGRDEHAHLLADRHDERVVHVEQVVVDLVHVDAGVHLPRLVVRGRQRREERDALVDVVVLPLPLVARDLDRQLRAARVLDLDQRACRRDRHGDEDDHRDQRPDDFGARAVVERGRHRALRLTERRDRVDHHAEHGHGDRDADPEDQHVQAVDLAAQLGDAFAQVQGPGGHGGARAQQRKADHCRGRKGPLHHLLWHYKLPCVKPAPPSLPGRLPDPCRARSPRPLRGTLARPPDRPAQARGHSAAFILRQEPTHLAGVPAVRLDGSRLGCSAASGAAQFNRRPMACKYQPGRGGERAVRRRSLPR